MNPESQQTESTTHATCQPRSLLTVLPSRYTIFLRDILLNLNLYGYAVYRRGPEVSSEYRRGPLLRCVGSL